jgi:tRNA pseudouridine55 synthase
MEGILLVNKPKGPTSFHIIKTLRKVTGVRKIGHAGTLDPGARGLLIVLVGKATKHAQYFERMKKRYVAKILLGVRTDTDDREGTVIEQKETSVLSKAILQKALSAFSGSIMQRPPRYSAVKYCGRRAYDLARQGKEFKLKPRQIEIHDLQLIYYDHPIIKIALSCSKGTYVRSIARDLGDQLGTGATLHSLIRTQIGRWSIMQSLHYKDMLDAHAVSQHLIPIEIDSAEGYNGVTSDEQTRCQERAST